MRSLSYSDATGLRTADYRTELALVQPRRTAQALPGRTHPTNLQVFNVEFSDLEQQVLTLLGVSRLAFQLES